MKHICLFIIDRLYVGRQIDLVFLFLLFFWSDLIFSNLIVIGKTVVIH